MNGNEANLERLHYCMIPTIWHSAKVKKIGMLGDGEENELGGAQGIFKIVKLFCLIL